MHIPQDYKQFDQPTMIVTTDSEQAKLFLANRNIMEAVGVIDSHYPSQENPERSSGQSPSGNHFAEQSEKTKVTSREKLYHLLSEDLMHRLQDNEFIHLIIAVPQEHQNELQESLHINLIKITQAFIPKLLTNEDMLDVIIHAREALDNP